MHNPQSHLLHFCIICFLSLFVSFWSSLSFSSLGPGHTVARHSAVLTLVRDPDQGLDQDRDPGPTLIPPVDPALVRAPMAALIPTPLILGAMDVVMDAHGQGPVLVQGLMGIGALAHHALLLLTGEELGRE